MSAISREWFRSHNSYSRFCISLFAGAIKPATATKKVGKAGPIVEKVVHPVEKDTKKLVNYVCGSNIYVDGEDIKVSKDRRPATGTDYNANF